MPERDEQDVDPTVYRRRLRNILKRTRESKEITQASAADAMSWSVSKLIRIETGAVRISVNDLRALLTHYGVTDGDEVNNLVQMARKCRETSWLAPYKPYVSEAFLAYIGHEDTAIRISSFEPILVPGLLQTEDYATSVLQVTRGPKDPLRISKLVELRVARQERLESRGSDVKFSYVLDESVVRRVVGTREIMRRQVDSLIGASEQGDASIRVIPFSAGIYRSIRVPFVVLEFTDPADPAILYIEHPEGGSLIREDGPDEDIAEGGLTTPPTTPPTYLQIFAELQQLTSEAETMRILRGTLEELES